MKSSEAKKPQAGATSIELTQEQLDGFLERVKNALDEGDYKIAKAMADAIVTLRQVINYKAAHVRKLVRIIFGASTEKMENLFSQDKKKEPTDGNENKKEGADDGNDDKEKPADGNDTKDDGAGSGQPKGGKKKKKGHGRNGADAFPCAEYENVEHPDLKAGDPCPECKEGKLYVQTKPGVQIRITGLAPFQGTIYELERLRCALCGTSFMAPLPESAGEKKYNNKAIVMIPLLKYGYGFPFNRLDSLQANLGIPLPSSTQWDVVNENTMPFQPIHMEFIRQAAQGDVLHNDDTNMKILSLIKENKERSPDRKGMFTTGIVSLIGENKISLFFTGRKHAGENLDSVLAQREQDLDVPIQMCDALNRNGPKEFRTIMVNCLTHGRRNFVDEVPCFPEECSFVIEKLADIYANDKKTKEMGLTPEERLHFHQKESKPVMEELHDWLKSQLEDKKVEPNSGLGGAINYMLNYWTELTGFLRIAGAPLDNNICERALKKAILHRKNSLFYMTEHGAAVGDMFLSIIHTCELAGGNPLDYMTSILDNASLVEDSPGEWMPWNYKATMKRLAQ